MIDVMRRNHSSTKRGAMQQNDNSDDSPTSSSDSSSDSSSYSSSYSDRSRSSNPTSSTTTSAGQGLGSQGKKKPQFNDFERRGLQKKPEPPLHRLHKETTQDFLDNLEQIVALGRQIYQSRTLQNGWYSTSAKSTGRGGLEMELDSASSGQHSHFLDATMNNNDDDETVGVDQNENNSFQNTTTATTTTTATKATVPYVLPIRQTISGSCGGAIISTTAGLREKWEESKSKLKPLCYTKAGATGAATIGTTTTKKRTKVGGDSSLVHPEDRLLYSNIRYASRQGQSQSQLQQREKIMMGSLFTWPKKNVDKSLVAYSKMYSSKSKISSLSSSSQEVKKKRKITKEGSSYGYGDEDSIFYSKRNDDIDYWDLEYGDGINESNNSNTNSSSSNYKESEHRAVLEEMITTAWNRAVHASSTAISPLENTDDSVCSSKQSSNVESNVAKDKNEDDEKRNANVDGFNHNNDKNDHDTVNTEDNDSNESNVKEKIEKAMKRISSNQVRAVMKCKALNISFEPIQVSSDDKNELSYRCQSCGNILKYTSREGVMNHLFGSNQSDGCCWKLINAKHREIIKDILQRQSVQLIDGLTHIIFTNAIQKKKENPDSGPFDWIDVMNFVESELKKSISEVGQNCMNEGTLKVHPNILPIPMNTGIFELVLKRLIDRYGFQSRPPR